MTKQVDRDGANAGFTLIELAIVVVIIGILASIAIPNYFSMMENSRRGSCISNQRNLVAHAALYAADNNIFAGAISSGDLHDDGIVPPDLCECPNSDIDDQEDYEIVITDGVVSDVNCLVLGDDHPWQP